MDSQLGIYLDIHTKKGINKKENNGCLNKGFGR